jgi:hypothetical protein
MNNKVLYVLSIILCFSLCIHCNKDENNNAANGDNDTALNRIKSLENELLHAHTKQAEQDILFKIWEMAYKKHEVYMLISAVDEENNQVIQNLAQAKGKVKVAITLGSTEGKAGETDGWLYTIEFTPIDIGNVYILLME